MHNNATCPDAALLERLVSGLIPEDEAWPIERHLAECVRCGRLADGLAPQDDLVAAMRVKSPIVDQTLPALDGLMARCRGMRADSAATPRVGDETPDAVGVDEQELLEPAQEPGEIGRVGPYRVVKVLGAGGMGVVYQAWQARPRRLVALKVSRARVPRARLLAEPEIVARLLHPNVVPVYEVGEHRGQPYFTMEMLEGGSLATQLAVAPLPARGAAELVQLLAKAVQFAHDQGVVHRDLKPSNVLLTKDGVPKIADFGLAKQLDPDLATTSPDRTHTGAIIGTPGYLAPEQAEGQPGSVGPPADVYALGAILYECLTGRPPFKAASLLETLNQVRNQDPVPPSRLQPGVPRDLQTICLKCLAKEPTKRFATAGDLATDLGRFLRGEPIVARPVPSWERVWKWVRRRPAAASLLLVSGLALAALVAGVLIHNAVLLSSEAEARAQRERADTAYQEARATLERMLNRLERPRVGDVPQIKELQRDLLEDALSFYLGAMARATDADPILRRDTAEACVRAATIQTFLGRKGPATENFERAQRLLEALPGEIRHAPATQAILASSCNNLGLIHVDASRWDAAERQFRAALAINESLVKAHPDEPGAQNALAENEHNLGVVCQLSGRGGEAEARYERAAEIRTRLVREHPEQAGYQAALADEYVNLALLYQGTGRVAQAEQCYVRIDDLLRPLVTGPNARSEYGLALTAAFANWSFLLSTQGQKERALDRLAEAIEFGETVLRSEPQHAVARHRTLNAHGTRAQLYQSMGRHADAARDWDRVVDLAEEKDWPVHRLHRSTALARAGNHARAASEVKALASGPRFSDDWYYYLATVLGLANSAVRSDGDLTSPEQATLAERYAADAVAMLRQLYDEGYFKSAENAKRLRYEPALEVLRDRPDFRRLLADVAGKRE